MSGDAVDVVARLKEESDVPLRSHGSLSLNRALLVDRVQVTVFLPPYPPPLKRREGLLTSQNAGEEAFTVQ